jgi:hypothetical protein
MKYFLPLILISPLFLGGENLQRNLISETDSGVSSGALNNQGTGSIIYKMVRSFNFFLLKGLVVCNLILSSKPVRSDRKNRACSDQVVREAKSATSGDKRTLPESFRIPVEIEGVRAPQKST